MAVPEIAPEPFALPMAVVTAYLIRWAADARALPRAAVTVFLLVMMAAMPAGAAIYFASPSRKALVEGLWASAAVMSISVFPPFAALLRHAARVAQGTLASPFHRSWAFPGSVAALVLANELLMGWTFSMAAGTGFGPATPTGVAAGLGTIASSSWFLFTMSAGMALATYLLRDRFDRPLLYVVAAQAAIMFLSPTPLESPLWVWWSLALGSGAMILLFVYVMEHIYRHREPNPAFATYLVRLIALYGLMMAGLFGWLRYGNPDLEYTYTSDGRFTALVNITDSAGTTASGEVNLTVVGGTPLGSDGPASSPNPWLALALPVSLAVAALAVVAAAYRALVVRRGVPAPPAPPAPSLLPPSPREGAAVAGSATPAAPEALASSTSVETVQDDSRRLSERLLVHLYWYGRPTGDGVARLDSSQEGWPVGSRWARTPSASLSND